MGCARTGLDVGTKPADAGPTACEAGTLTVGSPVRKAAAAQAPLGGSVLDPDDDLLIVIGGLSSSGVAAQSISAVRLGTAEAITLARTGDSRVDLGPALRAVWDPTSHRVLALGGSLWNQVPNPPDDTKQVFALSVSGQSADLALLPEFPDGETADVPLAAAVDPAGARLLAMPEKGSVAGPTKTWAMSTSPGGETWSLLDTDDDPAILSVQFSSLSYDPQRRRMIALGTTFDTNVASLWALSLDAPAGWSQLAGTLPPGLAHYAFILSTGFPLVWDDAACGFLAAVTDGYCGYQVWKLDLGDDAFTASPVGTAAQSLTRYSRGAGWLDLARGNFVFPSGFDCEEHDYVAGSVEFLPVTP